MSGSGRVDERLSGSGRVDERLSGSGQVDEWLIDIKMTLGYINRVGVKTGCICRVPEKIREANKEKSEEWYRPKLVAMGPIHRGTTIDLQTMELTKWRYMHKLFERQSEQTLLIQEKCMDIKRLESILRASYGDTIPMGTVEFVRIMLLDASFLVELLLRLSENHNVPSDMGYIDDDKKMSRLLTDLMLLENQVPFLLPTILSRGLDFGEGSLPDTEGRELDTEELDTEGRELDTEGRELSPKKLAQLLFGCNVASDNNFTNDVCHLLHIIHLCSPDPYKSRDIPSTHPLQLHRCARKLQAFGITITAPLKEDGGNINMASDASREFMDKFEFEIVFNEKQRKLIIPTLHIKEETEIRWRNFIAWEQIGGLIGVGYKFTSYAYFFKGLVCSVHDIQLLKEKRVIEVHTEAKDEDLLIMFQSIVTGAERRDARYNEVCVGLNKAKVNGVGLNKAKVNGVGGCCVLIFGMLWHYWRRFREWLHHGLISLLRSFMHTYLGTPWKFIGVVSAAALLGLTITQTIYAIRTGAELK